MQHVIGKQCLYAKAPWRLVVIDHLQCLCDSAIKAIRTDCNARPWLLRREHLHMFSADPEGSRRVGRPVVRPCPNLKATPTCTELVSHAALLCCIVLCQAAYRSLACTAARTRISYPCTWGSAAGPEPATGSCPARGPEYGNVAARDGWPTVEGNPSSLYQMFQNRCRSLSPLCSACPRLPHMPAIGRCLTALYT